MPSGAKKLTCVLFR
ncbi:unnamed protein product, partial [Cuscuta epithymum]